MYRPIRPEVGADFSKLRGVRERRVPRVGAQAEADEDEKAGRGGERVSLDERAGAAALSGFTLQWSRTIPPSAAVPCAPRPPLPSSPRPFIARDSRPRRTSASAKHFFIRSILPAGRAGAALPVLLHYACASSRA